MAMQSFITEDSEPYQKLFDEMMKRFNLEAKTISQKAGVSEVVLSRFRRARADLGASKLVALLLAVPPEARSWYISELFGQTPGTTSLRSQVAQAPPQEQAEVLRLMADLFESSKRQVTEADELAIASFGAKQL